MEPKNYKRSNNWKTYIHRVTIIVCIISFLYFLLNWKYDYIILISLLYFVIDVIINPKTISIYNTDLIITKVYLAGLISQKITISLDKILSISSGSIDILNDPDPESSMGILWCCIPQDGETPFDLYQLKYLDKHFEKRKITLNLHTNELNMLKNIMHKT